MDDGGWALSKNVVAQIATQAQSRSLPGSGQKFPSSPSREVGICTRALLERDLANLNLSYTKVFAPVGGYLTNVNTSPGTYINEGEQLLALVDAGSFWIAAYFKETQLKHIRDGASARITLMGHDLEPFEGKVVSVAWGVFLQDGSTIDSLPIVSQTIDWVRLPNRFPVRIHVTGTPPVPLRIGQTVSVAVQGG